MAENVNLQELLAAASGERIGRQSDTSAHFLALIDRGFGKTFLETDPVQAAAISQIIARAPAGKSPGEGSGA